MRSSRRSLVGHGPGDPGRCSRESRSWCAPPRHGASCLCSTRSSSCRDAAQGPETRAAQRVGAHNSVVGADQGFRAPSGHQESVRDSEHEDSASAPIAAGQRPRPNYGHPQAPVDFGVQGLLRPACEPLRDAADAVGVLVVRGGGGDGSFEQCAVEVAERGDVVV